MSVVSKIIKSLIIPVDCTATLTLAKVSKSTPSIHMIKSEVPLKISKSTSLAPTESNKVFIASLLSEFGFFRKPANAWSVYEPNA